MPDEKNKLAPGVHTFLDLSTAHLTRRDMDLLTHWSETQRGPMRTIDHTYGWFVNVPHDDLQEAIPAMRGAELSEDFLKVQEYARQHNCWWINFDSDAEELDGLATHDHAVSAAP